jgi:hypothetical protein
MKIRWRGVVQMKINIVNGIIIKHMDIWNNDQAMRILNGGQLHVDCSVSDSAIIKKHYFTIIGICLQN